MDPSAAHSKRASRGWWRLFTGLLFVVSATLGLGFYLPLKQTHQLLKQELTTAQGKVVQLTAALASAEASVQRVTAERSALESFKTQTAAEAQRFTALAERFTSEAEPALKAPFDKRSLTVVALGDGLSVNWTQAGLLNWKRTAPSPAGDKLLCPLVKQGANLGLPLVTVRAFAGVDPAAAADLAAAHTAAASLAASVADLLARRCGLTSSSISVASSQGDKASPLLSFEFRSNGSQG